MRSLKLITTVALSMVMSLAVPALAGSASAQQTRLIRGPEANGGVIEFFLQRIQEARRDRVKLVLSGHCVSSCTLYTALIKDGLLCAAPGTKLIFHQFVIAIDAKIVGNIMQSYKPGRSIEGSAFNRVWLVYPLAVRRAIMQSPTGGLPPHGREWVVTASKLGVPTC